MTSNKEKFLLLVSDEESGVMKDIEYRIKNRHWLNESFMIATKVLIKLEELNWTQKDLAAAMEVTPQQVNKIVRGKQNLTLDTIVKLQTILHIPLLASFFEANNNKDIEEVVTENKIAPALQERTRPITMPGVAARPHL